MHVLHSRTNAFPKVSGKETCVLKLWKNNNKFCAAGHFGIKRKELLPEYNKYFKTQIG